MKVHMKTVHGMKRSGDNLIVADWNRFLHQIQKKGHNLNEITKLSDPSDPSSSYVICEICGIQCQNSICLDVHMSQAHNKDTTKSKAFKYICGVCQHGAPSFKDLCSKFL